MHRRFALLWVVVGIVVLADACHAQEPPPPPRPHSNAPYTHRDSVRTVGRMVYDLIRLVDRVGRPQGRPPSTLDPVLENWSYVKGQDLWGRDFRYQPSGEWYEVRSAGPDGQFDTADDIVGKGRLGRIDPCEMRDEYRVWVKDESPECSQ